MNVYEKIKKLCSEREVSVSELERTLDLSNGSISKWNRSSPNAAPLQKIATFFNVSTDYLLGRTNRREMNPSQEIDLKKAIKENIAMSYGGKELNAKDRALLETALHLVFREVDDTRKD